MFWNKYPYTDFDQMNLDALWMRVAQLGRGLKDISNNIAKYVAEKVDELISSGAFDDVVKVYFDDAVKSLSGLADVQTARKFRVIDEVGYQDVAAKGTNFVYVGNLSSGTGIRITETDGNGNIIRYNDELSVPKCNSVCYDPTTNYLYIAAPPLDTIYIVDYATFTLVDTFSDADYDFVSIATNNGKTYALVYYYPMETFRIVEKVGNDFITKANIAYIDNTPFSKGWQSFEVVDNMAYGLLATPNALICADLDTGRVNVYSLGEGNGYYPYGEIEGITYYDGDIYVSSLYGDGADVYVNQVFKSNILGSLVADGNRIGQYPYLSERSTAYVDSTATGTNPKGWGDDPFSCLTEAIGTYLYTQGKYFTGISCAADSDFSGELATLKNCFINFNGGGSVIGELVLENCAGTVYNFETVDRCAAINYVGKIGGMTGGSQLQLESATVTLNNITPTVNAANSTVVEATAVTYGTTSNLIKLEVQA